MCIAASVGQGGNNGHSDVRTVQLLLQLNGQLPVSFIADGHCSASTIAAIAAFARGVVGGMETAALIAPGGTTLRALHAGLPAGISSYKLQAIYIDAPADTVLRFYDALVAGMTAGAITSPLRQAHFLAQVGHESGELRYTQELADGTAYEGRKDLGNTQPGDGPRFKGRGLIQLTGRANYAAFGKSVGRDFMTDTTCRLLATDPALAVDVAVWFWTTRKLNTLADQDDLLAATKRINGGTNGLQDRARLLDRARWFLLPAPGTSTAAVQTLQAVATRTQRRRPRRQSITL